MPLWSNDSTNYWQPPFNDILDDLAKNPISGIVPYLTDRHNPMFSLKNDEGYSTAKENKEGYIHSINAWWADPADSEDHDLDKTDKFLRVTDSLSEAYIALLKADSFLQEGQ